MKAVNFIKGCLLGFALVATTFPTYADWESICSTVHRVRAWPGGSDLYGLRVELKDQMAGCSHGFYIPLSGANKQNVFNIAVAGKMSGQRVCVQNGQFSKRLNGNLCYLNHIYIE